MAITEQTVRLTRETLDRVREELRALGLDGWLLFNFHNENPVASRMLGLPELTRRYLVYLRAEGDPIAITHRIEQQPWEGWIGENRPYSSWRELETRLAELLGSGPRVAMEYFAGDGVPYVDLIPAGAVEMIRAAGARIETSADLVSAFYARWSAEGEASHRRAARAVQETAHAAFARIAAGLRSGAEMSEWSIRGWIGEEFRRRGIMVGGDAIVAVNANAANPHYAPAVDRHAPIRTGDLVLIDLWGKEPGDEAVYADQTWMAYAGDAVPDRWAGIFAAVRDARDGAIEVLRARHAAGETVAGFEVDDASRSVVVERGYGEQFIHRTGHSIDRELHGSGPNIDNLETRDTRRLITGVGFSIEPGIYLAGDVGFRSEVNVFMGPDGPEVTTPDPQREIYALLADPRFS